MSIDIGKRPPIDESNSSKSHVVAIGNGDVISPKESPNHVQNDGNNSIENEALINGDNSKSNTNFVMTEKEKTDGPKESSTPVTPKRLQIEGEDVKKKPLCHKRGGSSVSTGQVCDTKIYYIHVHVHVCMYIYTICNILYTVNVYYV